MTYSERSLKISTVYADVDVVVRKKSSFEKDKITPPTVVRKYTICGNSGVFKNSVTWPQLPSSGDGSPPSGSGQIYRGIRVPFEVQ